MATEKMAPKREQERIQKRKSTPYNEEKEPQKKTRRAKHLAKRKDKPIQQKTKADDEDTKRAT